MMKRVIEKHEKYYKSHQGKDIDCLVIEKNNFKQMIGDFHGKIEDKNKEIIKLKQALTDLNH